MNNFEQKTLEFLRDWSQGRPLRRVHSGPHPEAGKSWWKCGSRLTRLSEATVQRLVRLGHVRLTENRILTLAPQQETQQ